MDELYTGSDQVPGLTSDEETSYDSLYEDSEPDMEAVDTDLVDEADEESDELKDTEDTDDEIPEQDLVESEDTPAEGEVSEAEEDSYRRRKWRRRYKYCRA